MDCDELYGAGPPDITMRYDPQLRGWRVEIGYRTFCDSLIVTASPNASQQIWRWSSSSRRLWKKVTVHYLRRRST